MDGEQITDVAGQVVSFEYQKDQGEIYLGRVSWGPANAFAAVVEFANRSDVITSYALGFPVITQRRIAALRVEAFGEVERRYERPTTRRLRCRDCRQCAWSGVVAPIRCR